MGSRTLSGTQFGKESAHGTAVAADTILYCVATLPESDREIHLPQVDIGKRTPGLIKAAETRRVLADGITLADKDGAYFEMMPLLFSMCLVGNVTATEQNSGEGDYLWTFTSPQTGAETVDSITLEMYDDTQAYEVAYCLARSLTVSFDSASGEAHMSADLFGDRVIQTTKTSLTTYPAAEMIVGKLARVYVDDTYASLGSSELEGALVNGEITINGGVHPKHLGSSSRLFGSHGQDEIQATARFTFERTSAVATEELHFRPAADYVPDMRAVRVTITGKQIGSGDNSTLQIDMMGVWQSWQPIAGDTEGNTYDVATLRVGYDDTSGSNPLVVNVTTTISSI